MKNILEIQDKVAENNSYYRSPKVIPNIYKLNDYQLSIRTVDNEVLINRIEEVIFSIIVSFKYTPYWLIQQWYESQGIGEIGTLIENWIKVGLIWAESSPTGIYLRPTRFLLDLFKEEDRSYYVDIPYNLLTHDVSEQQMLFDIQIGNEESEIYQVIMDEEKFPVYHPLNLKSRNEYQGTIAVRESDFRLGYKRLKSEELLYREEELTREIKSGEKYTSELVKDFSLFPIIKYNTLNQEGKGDIITQTPDVLVPLPRKDGGLPQSYAIELELSAKTLDKYVGIMDSYKNNNKFLKVFYLCGNARIATLIKQAFQKIGGLGTCELYLLPFTPPALRLSNFSAKDEQIQYNLLEASNV